MKVISISALGLLLLAGCGTYTVTQDTAPVTFKLPRPESRPRPVVLDGQKADLSQVSLVVLGAMTSSSHENRVDDALQEIYWRSCDMGADTILLAYSGHQMIGVARQPMGFGMYRSTPVYQRYHQAVALRTATHDLGFFWNQEMRVVAVYSSARKAGIRKGDEVTMIDGMVAPGRIPYTEMLRHPLNGYVDTKAVGDLVRIDLVREGVGPMSISVPVLKALQGEPSGPTSPWAARIDRDDLPSRIKWPSFGDLDPTP